MASPNPNDPKEILKRIEQESTDEKRRKTLDILQREKSMKTPSMSIATKMWEKYSQEIYKKCMRPEFQKTVMVTAFFAAATFVSYKIESKYDRMRKKATRTKSFKQEQVEKEDEYISKHLNTSQFESVPIQDEVEHRNPYQFEETTNVFDTKDYLL